jgi:hypothetical protein
MARRGSRGRRILVASWSTHVHAGLLVRGQDAAATGEGRRFALANRAPPSRSRPLAGRQRRPRCPLATSPPRAGPPRAGPPSPPRAGRLAPGALRLRRPAPPEPLPVAGLARVSLNQDWGAWD